MSKIIFHLVSYQYIVSSNKLPIFENKGENFEEEVVGTVRKHQDVFFCCINCSKPHFE